jgi:hypothetical protein
MTYRIKKETRGDGAVLYIPQKKILFWWFDCYEDIYPGVRTRVIRTNKKKAKKWIDLEIEIIKYNKIKKIEFINK